MPVHIAWLSTTTLGICRSVNDVVGAVVLELFVIIVFIALASYRATTDFVKSIPCVVETLLLSS